jgi:hypothetical protein
VANLTTYPVALDELEVGERTVRVDRDWIVAGQDAFLHVGATPAVVLRSLRGAIPNYVTLRLPQSVQDELWPRTSPSSEPLRLATHVVGLAEPVTVTVERERPALYGPAIPAWPSVEQVLDRHPFLAASERPGFLEIRPGAWEVEGDLVLPEGYGLLAFRSTRLRFDEGAVLLAEGPLLLHGAEEGEIELAPKEHDWAGIVVLEAGEKMPSSLAYVTIRGTSGVRRDGWSVPGGVTFYRSPVALSHCRLLDTTAPVALYVTHTRFECEESEFGRVSAQAARVEHAEGRVKGCRFHDVLGDAIAARGSRLDVQDIRLLRVYDQGILASQNSMVTVRGGFCEEVGVAVASRDASHVRVEGVLIRQAWTAGLAAYSDGLEAGPASIHASGVTFESQNAVQAVVQPGNSVRLEGIPAATRELDTSRLSWRQSITTTIRPLGYGLGPAIWLVGYDVASRDLDAGEPLQMTLYWNATGALDRDYTVFIHIRDAAGELVAGWDTMPRANTFPTTHWPAGKVIDDGHVVPLDIPPGEYHIALGMYHLASGQRLPVRGPDGEPVADNTIVLGQEFRVH